MDKIEIIHAEADRNFGGCNPYDAEPHYTVSDVDDFKKQAFIEGAIFGASLTGWISVNERLPTKQDASKNGHILVAFKSGNILSEFWGWVVDDEERHMYTHWMPLPEPPAVN